jgi:hypothetical protein
MGSWGALLLALACVAQTTSRPETGRVRSETLAVFDEPDETGFITGQLRRDDVVRIRGIEEGGWVRIEPPAGSLSWIDQDAIMILARDRARVVDRTTPIRSGRAGARLPGPSRSRLPGGAIVRLLDQPPLELPQRSATRVLRAIETPRTEDRYVRADGIATSDPARPRRVSQRGAATMPPLENRFATVGPAIAMGSLTPEGAAELQRTEARHRATLREPLDRWQLADVAQGYQALAETSSDVRTRAQLEARRELVRRQIAVAEAARRFAKTSRESRPPAGSVESARDSDADSAVPAERFDAVGMLQASATRVEGQPVYALVGDDGQTAAYLIMPPGVGHPRLLSSRVGVRGTVRYDSALRSRIIVVTELEVLAEAP